MKEEMNNTKIEKKELSRVSDKYPVFGTMSILFAIFYAICFHRAGTGITVPIFTIGNTVFLIIWLKNLDRKRKAESWFYFGSTFLLGISVFLTDNGFIRFFSKAGIFILCISYLIYQFHEDQEWGISKYTKAIFKTIVHTIGKLNLPIADLLKKKKGKKNYVKNIFLGILISIPLAVFVLLLLSGADVVFANTIALDQWFQVTNTMTFILLVLAVYFWIYAFMIAVEEKSIEEKEIKKEKKEAVIAITFTTILLVIYLIFSFIQVYALFLGKMDLPSGYSYSAYAREGFFQLLTISFLNMFLVMICLRLFQDQKLLKIILTGISICTYIIIFSSGFRMAMYVKAYRLTFMRIFVFWLLGLLAMLMIGVLFRIYQDRFPTFRFTMVIVTILYLMLAFMKPDYVVAKYNLNQILEKVEERDDDIYYFLDINHIYSLSADALPAIRDFVEEAEYREFSENDQISLLRDMREHIAEYEFADEVVRDFNLSRYIASRDIDWIMEKMNWE